ncbi:MAG: hypothetical protein IIY29_05505, partial [Firmicutes bacterium]|nr:hypothetical protein [Bacillota bacterium]
MKSFSKKLLGVVLSVAMIITMTPFTAFPSQAATNLDGGFQGMDADVFTALGFDVTELPEGYDPDTTDNPLGRDKTPGNQVFELAVAGQNGAKIYGKGNNNVKGTDISGIPGGSGIGMEMFASAAGDFDGDGLCGEIVYVGYEEVNPSEATYKEDGFTIDEVTINTSQLQMRVYNGRTETYGTKKDLAQVTPFYTLPQTNLLEYVDARVSLTGFDMYWQNLLQVTAGDYDGDGISEIAVYVAENEQARVDVYKYQKKSTSAPGDWINMSNWSRVWSHALNGEYAYVPNMVSLVSGDFNRDGTDDLGISYGSAVVYEAYFSSAMGRMESSKAVMLWGDRTKMLQSSSPIDLAEEELGEQNRVSLIKGDLDQDGVAELIATGQPKADLEQFAGFFANVLSGNMQRTVVTYTYDQDLGLLINSADLMEPVKGSIVTATIEGQESKQWKSENGFDQYYYSVPYMKTNAAVFQPTGSEYPYLYLDSCLYQSVKGSLTLKGELDENYDGEHAFDLGTKFWGARNILGSKTQQSQYAEYGAAAADINGSGAQILVTSSFAADTGNHSCPGYHRNQYAVVNGLADGKMQATITCSENDSTESYQGQALTFLDCDVDTIIMEYTGKHYLTYSDPKVLAVIAAAPYFEDVDEATGYEFAGNNTTSWGRTHGDSDGESVSVSFEFGAWAENSITTATGQIDLNGGLVYTLEWEKSRTLSHEYTMTFGTYGDQDAVAFYSIPTENYVYRVYVPDEKGGYETTSYVVSNTFDPAYQVLTLDYYESIQKNYETLPKIRGKAITSTPGDPSSYPSSTSGYKVITQWDRDAAGVGYGNGSIEQEISITAEEETSYSMGAEFSFELGGGLSAQVDMGQSGYESTGGMQFAINPAGGWSTTTMKGTTIAAEVANMPVEFQQYGYYFDWRLFSYYYTFGSGKEETLEFHTMEDEDDQFTVEEDVEIGEATTTRIPVISYIVNNVSQPPRLPDDFQQDYDRTTSDSNVMTWTYDSPVTAFIISKYFDFPVGGGIQQIARIEPGDANHYRIKYDEDGEPYKEFFFTDTNLSPYTEYQYAIQIERLVPPPPLSTPSALTPARTKAEDGYPNITIAESDDEQDQKLLVYPDKNAYLSAGVTGPEGENIANYYSVVQYQWQKKDKGAWTDLVGETNKTLTFASAGVDTAGEYRCRVNVITKAGNVSITAYSNSVELTHAKRTSYMKEVSVTDVAGGGIQLYAEVANAHKDSASIPGGVVTFNLTANATGQPYQFTAPLNANGMATAVVDQILPEGMYSVSAYYSGSYIFKSCSGKALYLSQRATGYDIDLPNSVTYGDEAQIVFREASKVGGITSTEDVNSDTTTMYLAAPLSRAALSGAVAYESSAVEGTKYYYTDTDGVKWYFTAPADGAATFENGFALFGDDLTESSIKAVPGKAGTYLLQAGTPAGVYRITMKAADADETAVASIEVQPRQVTVQIPKDLTAGENESAAAEDIQFKDLALISGSWADCDITEDKFKYETTSIAPEYYNTAGTQFTAANVRKLCGSYSIIGTKQLPNYQIVYRSGQLTVLGAAYKVNIGARPFDGLNVGKVYMMAPEIGIATGPLNGPGQAIKQVQAGVRMVFSAQPDNGYEIYDWYINGKAQGSKSSTLVYTQLAEDVDVEVQFAIKQNTLTFGTAGDEDGGTLTVEPSLTSGSVIRQNSRFNFTAEAKEGYHFKEWRYTEQGLGTVYDDEDSGEATSTYDFYMPNNSCSLYAVFERDGYVFNYIDGNNANGLTATYENEEGRIVTAKPGAIIKGGTEITVAPASGYDWDQERLYISQGTQGEADYGKGTYTLTLDQDTTVYGWTVQQAYDLTLGYELARVSRQIPDSSITYYIGDQAYTFSCEEYLENSDKVIKDIPGGTPISVTVDAPAWVDLKGWTSSETKITAETGGALLGTEVEVDGAVQKNKTYNYTYAVDGGGTNTYHFTSPVNGTVRSLSGENVTLYSSSATYTIPALGQDEKLTVGLKEKPVHTVTMKDIAENGTYSYELPPGGFNGETANIINVHDGEDLTVTVIPNPGKTVSYWKTTWKDGEEDKFVNSPATSLRYTIPNIITDYGFEPIFSTSTYNLISWPTISESQNGLNLDPESGYISSVASGGDFKFKLSGDSLGLLDAVYANDNEFTAAGNVVGDTTYKVENGIYSITNVTGNQEITVKLKNIGVTVNGIDINALSGVGWTYDSGTQTLTLARSGLNVSGSNDQTLAPNLRIVTTEAVGSLTLDDLTVTSAASDPVLQIAGDTIVTITDSNTINAIGGATAFLAESDLTLRGNGALAIEGSMEKLGGYALFTNEDLTITGTAEISIHEANENGLRVGGTLTVGANGSTLASPILRTVSDTKDGASLHNVDLYGGEISAYGKECGIYLGDGVFGSNEVYSINCYDGIFEVSSTKFMMGGAVDDDAVRAYYKQGYLCRSKKSSDQEETDFVTYSKLAKDYNRFETMPAYDQVINGTGGCVGVAYEYVRLSPLTSGAENDDLTLSVKYNGKTYSHTLSKSGSSIYYIDVDDETTTELKEMDWLDPNTDMYYQWYEDESRRTIDLDDIVVAEYVMRHNGLKDLHFNAMKLEQHTDYFNNDEPRYIRDSDQNIIGYFCELAPATGKFDYTISGPMEGEVSSASRGTICADGRIFASQCFPLDTEKTDNIQTLTLDNLTHVELNVGDFPVYLQGNNYLIGSDTSVCPLIASDTLDLRGRGTLTISTPNMTALSADNVELTDVAALTLFSDTSALGASSVKYYSGEGDNRVELPYGLGWLEDAGSKAGDAETKGSVDTGTDYKYVKFYTTSTDARPTPEKLVYDKGVPGSAPTVDTVALTPPTVMGVPHLFTPGEKGCKAELYKGNEKLTELTEDTNYTYTEGDNKVIGDLTMKYDSEDLKNLEVGEYTVRVYFEDEDTADATTYTLNIPLTVQDTAHVVGELIVVDPDPPVITLTRGNSKNITTKFTGTTPKTYDWSIAAVDAGGMTEGISLPDTHGTANTVSVDANAENGAYKITIKSYADQDKTQQLGEATVDLNVVPKAESIAVSCEGETPSGDESYMLNHNTLDGSMKDPWDFNAAVTMDDGSDADPAKISWSLWGGTMSGTAVDGDGKLTINPNETGLLNSGYLILTAIYENADGSKLEKPIKIRLSEDAIIGFTQPQEGGTIDSAAVTNPDGTPVPRNTEVTFTATPDPEYEVDTWYINGQKVEGEETMTFTTEKMGRYNVWATFTRAKICEVSFDKEGPGAITAETSSGTLTSGESVAKGTDVTFTAVPDTYAKVTKWTVTIDGEEQDGYETCTDNELTLADVQDSVDVKVSFEVPDRTVTITAG